MLENPSAYAISEEDLELLNQISLKLNNIPDMAFFGKAQKKPLGRRAQNSNQAVLERSKSSAMEIKVIMESHTDHLESSQFDPSSQQNPAPRSPSPRNADYREELKSKGMRLDLTQTSELRERSQAEFNPQILIKSFDYFADITRERANHYKRFRLATMNSDLSLRTADIFLKHFSELLLNCSSSFLIQKIKNHPTLIECYGELQQKNVIFYLDLSGSATYLLEFCQGFSEVLPRARGEYHHAGLAPLSSVQRS